MKMYINQSNITLITFLSSLLIDIPIRQIIKFQFSVWESSWLLIEKIYIEALVL